MDIIIIDEFGLISIIDTFKKIGKLNGKNSKCQYKNIKERQKCDTSVSNFIQK